MLSAENQFVSYKISIILPLRLLRISPATHYTWAGWPKVRSEQVLENSKYLAPPPPPPTGDRTPSRPLESLFRLSHRSRPPSAVQLYEPQTWLCLTLRRPVIDNVHKHSLLKYDIVVKTTKSVNRYRWSGRSSGAFHTTARIISSYHHHPHKITGKQLWVSR